VVDAVMTAPLYVVGHLQMQRSTTANFGPGLLRRVPAGAAERGRRAPHFCPRLLNISKQNLRKIEQRSVPPVDSCAEDRSAAPVMSSARRLCRCQQENRYGMRDFVHCCLRMRSSGCVCRAFHCDPSWHGSCTMASFVNAGKYEEGVYKDVHP
jgi:hypothetical protein